jgi:hypothetical protein
MDEHRPVGSEERLASLERTVQDLQAVVERQARHIDSLERAQAAAPPFGSAALVEGASPSAAPQAEPAGPRGIDRRRLLVGGATAAAATAAAALGAATPAAAADGDSIVLGADNTSSNMTTVTAPLDGFPVINAVNEGTGAALQGSNTSSTIPAIRGISTDNAGVFGQSETQEGVYGSSTSGTGVYGQSTSGTGVDGRSTNSAGVFGLSSNDFGVAGVSSTSAGVRGGGATGLLGVGTTANLSIPAWLGRVAPTSDAIAHAAGDVVTDVGGNVWLCVAAGTPGTWRKVAGPGTAGSLHLLAAPVRAYDSRPGTSPTVGPKTKLSGNTSRSLSVRANSTGVPAEATAVSVTLLLVNASTSGGNLTLWAGNASRPSANAMVWGGNAGRFASTAITRISPTGTVLVAASAPTDLVLDIVGYYL